MSSDKQKSLHNKHGGVRICDRCHKDYAVTRIKSQWICEQCLIKRKDRQRNSHEREQKRKNNLRYCECGGLLAHDETICHECLKRALYKISINESNSVDDLKPIILVIAERLGMV